MKKMMDRNGSVAAGAGVSQRETPMPSGGRTARASVAARLPVRRGLSEVEAAVYLSLSPSFFRRLVDQAIMPASRLCLLPCSRIRAHG